MDDQGVFQNFLWFILQPAETDWKIPVRMWKMCEYPRMVPMVSGPVPILTRPMIQGSYLLTWSPRSVLVVTRNFPVSDLPMNQRSYLLTWCPRIIPVVSWAAKNLSFYMIQESWTLTKYSSSVTVIQVNQTLTLFIWYPFISTSPISINHKYCNIKWGRMCVLPRKKCHIFRAVQFTVFLCYRKEGSLHTFGIPWIPLHPEVSTVHYNVWSGPRARC